MRTRSPLHYALGCTVYEKNITNKNEFEKRGWDFMVIPGISVREARI